jgi:hypothetical protein
VLSSSPFFQENSVELKNTQKMVLAALALFGPAIESFHQAGSVAQLILSVNPGKEEQIGPVVDAYFTPLLRDHFSELSAVPATASRFRRRCQPRRRGNT